jgi:4-amino-4-deoxy-L-arabinose transferase-like glycosyltransferase
MLIGLLFRLYAAQDLRWSSDTVPIIDIGQRFFRDGLFPLHGSLSSVAAYYMPGLVYLFMPAMLLTNDPALIIILTALAANLIGILLVYRLCSEFFDREIGLVAAALYTFSTIGIESAYTAWAQMNVGVFFMGTIYFLYRWAAYMHGRDMTLAILAAVFVFMIHFAAFVLAIVIAVFYFLIPRPRPAIPVKWLIASAIGTIVLLAPYGYFEITRDFVDVRAFISRKDLVPPEVWLQIDQQRARDFAGMRGATQAESGPDQPSFIDQARQWGTFLSMPGTGMALWVQNRWR